jgi:glycosyltransferase involved in cell wall biosynthesis
MASRPPSAMTPPVTKRVSAIVSCFRGERYLPAFLESCAAQTIAHEVEIVLIHNDPSEAEKRIVERFAADRPGFIRHVMVGREPLAVSTNRALDVATGRYVCVWNIDDLRTPSSLEECARTLDENPEAGFTYGDNVSVTRFTSTDGLLVSAPEFDRARFVRSMHLGPFYMWRRDLLDTLGYWDEQLRMGGDFDYAIRLALGSTGRKTRAVLGYYLDEGMGLSTSATSVQPIERTVLELRYGSFDKVDVGLYRAARRYRIGEVRHGDSWTPVRTLAPARDDFARHRGWLLVALLRWPRRSRPRVMRRVGAAVRQLQRLPAAVASER